MGSLNAPVSPRRAPSRRWIGQGRRALLLVAAAVCAIPVSAETASSKPSQWIGGGGLAVSVPVGAFADATDEGVGIASQAVFTPGGGIFGIRFQVGGVLYGSRNVGAPVPGTGGLIQQDLSVENWLVNAGVGPQIVARSGPVRPYAYALAGLGYFATSSVLHADHGDNGNDHSTDHWNDDYHSTTNFDDTTFAWSVGAGVLIPVSRSTALDLGVQYVGNGTVRYLAEGDLEPSRTGAPPIIIPRNTDANVIQVTIGFTFLR
jgi:opacity protein-like surface antigen